MYDHKECNGYRITTDLSNGEIDLRTFVQLDIGINNTMIDIFWDEFYNFFLQNDTERKIVDENMLNYGDDNHGSIRIDWLEIDGDIDPKLKPILERFWEYGCSEMNFVFDVQIYINSYYENMEQCDTQEERDDCVIHYINTCLKYYPNSTPDDFKGDFDDFDVDEETIIAQAFFMREAA